MENEKDKTEDTEGVTTVTTEKTVAGEDSPVKGRARFEAIFKEENPDTDYSDDEAFYGALDEYDNRRGEELSRYKDFDDRLKAQITADPRAGLFLSNLMNGMNIVDNLLDVAGPELAEAVSSDAGKAKMDALRKQAEEVEAKRQANMEASQSEIDEFLKDKPQEDVEAFDDYIVGLFDQFAEGRFTREMLERLYKGFKYDSDMSDAVADAEVRGRNAKIVATKQERTDGDGVPSLASMSTRKPQKATRSSNRSIWDA